MKCGMRWASAVLLLTATACALAEPLTVNTTSPGSPQALYQGIAVQHFTVPYGCLGTGFAFYCDVTGNRGLVDHEVALQVYSADRKHLATVGVKVRNIPDGQGWIVLKGLRLKPDSYYAQLFTNSESLAPHLRTLLHSRSDYRGGHAATGWEGGVPLGLDHDFEARLVCERTVPAIPRLGTDPRFLVRQGRANAPIVVAVDAPLAVQTAARELRDHLKGLSGAEVPILLEDDFHGGPMIAVGWNRHLPPALQRAAFGALAEQTLIIKPAPGMLLLAGDEPCGPLYAVYEYLHRLGVRWYAPDFTLIPHQADLPLPTGTVTYAPPVIGRHLVAGIRADHAWLARNRLTTDAHWGAVGREYGRPRAEGPDMHTAYRLIPESVLREHPDWTSEVGGQRTRPANLNTWDLCYTNPDARAYFIRRTIEWAREHPEAETVWIGQNDSPMPCECARCETFRAAHGGKRSAVIVQLVNDLAEAMVAAGMSDRKVKTLAYGWSAEPPTGMAVSDRATIAVCQYRQIAGWRRLAQHVDTYLYSNWADYWAPSPTVYSEARELIGDWRDGADNLYSSISGFMGSYGSDMVHLRAWLTARLMWNPASDPQALAEDFCRGYYGPAAPAVLESLRLRHAGAGTEAAADTAVAPATLRQINRVLEAAYQRTPPGVYRRHLEMAWISTLWTDFWLGAGGLGQYDGATSTWTVPLADAAVRQGYGKLAKQFMIAHGINALGGQVRLDPTALSLDKVGVAWPATGLTGGGVSAVVVPGAGGLLTGLRDDASGFAPLKATWGEMALRYPLFSSTEDDLNGVQITTYEPTRLGDNRASMAARGPDTELAKTVALDGRVMRLSLTAHAQRPAKLDLTTAVMFDLLDEGFGKHPTVAVEQRDGSWKRRQMGVETTFWWTEGPLDLGTPTGRLVIASQTRPAGICLTFDPAQLGSLDFWYDNLMDHWPKREQHRMLRLFLRSRGAGESVAAGTERQLGYSLEILPDASALLGRPAQ